jgi:3-deoxy-D-manno-octulosonic-acid transferase
MLLQFHLFIYSFIIDLYNTTIECLSPFHTKAKLLRTGRKRTRDLLNALSDQYHHCIFIHVASLGEFEQARPLIERLKIMHPEKKIVLSFFSPSGYEIRKNYPLADLILYLPADNQANARRLWDVLRPSQIIWVKYDFWYYLLHEAYTKKIPLMLICANFRKDQIFFSRYGLLFRKILSFFNPILVQNKSSQQLLKEIELQSELCPDTRFDRVSEIAHTLPELPFIPRFIHGKQCIIFGSTWPADEAVIANLINHTRDIKFIIAPHQIEAKQLNQLRKKINAQSILYSKRAEYQEEQILIIDNIGMLATLYRYATLAYIGGGFGVSVHNILEAAVYGIPIICGPNYTKSAEAIELKEKESLFVAQSGSDLINIATNLLKDPLTYDTICKINKQYVVGHLGGTEKIIKYLEYQK